MSRDRPRRDVDGILLLDKPAGASSTRALGRVKWLLGARKGGHTGALDPLATGLLPLCFGQATKVSGFLLEADKRYRCVARLGVETDSYDLDGTVRTTRPVPAFDDADLEALAADFRGAIEQVPPMVSALKQDGQRLYKLARKGIEVERPPRAVTIHALTTKRLADDRIELDVHCSKGTYIRSLAHDLGQRLGCGAAVESLRRTGHGVFALERAVTLETIERLYAEDDTCQGIEALLLRPETALTAFPAVEVDAQSGLYWCQGQPVFVAQLGSPGPRRVFERSGRFLGIGAVNEDGMLAPNRRFVEV